jgi:signal peptidase II
MIAIFFIGDRVLKSISINNSESIKLIGDFFSFSFSANYFIAFSLPISGIFLESAIFILILLMAALFFYLLRKNNNNNAFLLFGLLMIIFGAISNYIDRLKFGFVIDYLYLKYFTVFNLADVLIVCGSILILFQLYKKTDL